MNSEVLCERKGVFVGLLGGGSLCLPLPFIEVFLSLLFPPLYRGGKYLPYKYRTYFSEIWTAKKTKQSLFTDNTIVKIENLENNEN